MTTNQTPATGHYHDPEGKYDYCADPKCPRVAKGLYSRDEISRMTNDALDELWSHYLDTGNAEGVGMVHDEQMARQDAEAERAYDAEQDRQQMMHDEMINDMLASDGRWG